jgi:hypothetical protein
MGFGVEDVTRGMLRTAFISMSPMMSQALNGANQKIPTATV